MTQPNDPVLAVLGDILQRVIFPVIVAAITIFVFGAVNDRKKRRNASLLGVAIIESLQEEVQSGISIMTEESKRMKMGDFSPPRRHLPHGSWQSVATIPDDVLLQIITISKDKSFTGFHPKEVRIHCKNYFQHMCANFNSAVNLANEAAKRGEDWKPLLLNWLDPYIKSAQEVYQLLQECKTLLEKNAKARNPK